VHSQHTLEWADIKSHAMKEMYVEAVHYVKSLYEGRSKCF